MRYVKPRAADKEPDCRTRLLRPAAARRRRPKRGRPDEARGSHPWRLLLALDPPPNRAPHRSTHVTGRTEIMTEHVKTEVSEGIMTLTLSRADKKNALSNAMYSALSDGLERAEKDASVRVVLPGRRRQLYGRQ